jgi:WD40 repeat protein
VKTAAVTLRELVDQRLTSANGQDLTGVSQDLVHAVRRAVAARDADVLTRVWEESLPLHKSMPAAGKDVVDEEALAGPYRKEQPPTAHALRALAGLGLALIVDDEEQGRECLRGAESWLAVSCICPPEPVTTEPPGPEQVNALLATFGLAGHRRIARLTEPATLHDPVRLTAWIWLLDLAGLLPRRQPGPACGVLFDEGEDGLRATLSLTAIPGLPPILAPDPAMMTLCSADPAFQQMLGNVWTLAARPAGAVLWSVGEDGRQTTRVTGPSIGGAFAVLYREVQPRRWERLRPRFLVRRERTLIVGAVSQHAANRLLPVDGYEKKLKVVDKRDRLIVPKRDKERAQKAAAGAGVSPTIHPVTTLDQAARRSRVPQLRQVLAAGIVVAVAAAATGGVVAAVQARNRAEAQAALGVSEKSNAAKAFQDRAATRAATDPALALRLSAAAVRLDPTPAARGNLVGLLTSTRYRGSLVPNGAPGGSAAIQLSADGTVMLSTGQQRGVLWTGDGGRRWTERGRLSLDTWQTPALSPSGRLIAVPGEHDVRLLDITGAGRGMREVGTIPAGIDAPVAFGRGDDLLLLATVPPQVWDVSTPGRPKVLNKPDDATERGAAMTICPDSPTVVLAAGPQIIVYELAADGTLRHKAERHADAENITHLACVPGGQLLTGTSAQIGVGDTDGTVALWDLGSPGQQPVVMNGLKGSVGGLSVSQDGRHVAVSGENGTTIAAFGSNFPPDSPPAFASTVTVAGSGGAAFGQDGRTLLTGGGADGELRTWEIADLLGSGGTANEDAPFSPAYAVADGLLAASAFGGIVVLFQPAPDGTLTRLSKVDMPTRHGDSRGTPTSVALSPDGRLLAAAEPDGAQIWSLEDPRRPRPRGVIGSGTGVSALAFTRDPAVAVAIDPGGEASTWDLTDPDTPTQVSRLPGVPQARIAVSAAAPVMATAAADGSAALLWRMDDPRRPVPVATVPGQEGAGPLLALSPDGTTLLHGLRLWNVTDVGAPVGAATLSDYSQPVNDARFAPRGHLLATADALSRMRLWDVNDLAHPVALTTVTRGLQGHPPHLAVVFAADGSTVHFGGEAIYGWPVGDAGRMSADPLEYTCAFLGHGPTLAEWDAVSPGQQWREVCT